MPYVYLLCAFMSFSLSALFGIRLGAFNELRTSVVWTSLTAFGVLLIMSYGLLITLTYL